MNNFDTIITLSYQLCYEIPIINLYSINLAKTPRTFHFQPKYPKLYSIKRKICGRIRRKNVIININTNAYKS